MEADSKIKLDSRSVWESLKDKLGDELDENSTQEALTLLKENLFLPRGFCLDVRHPKQLLEQLENRYSEKECIEILRHVFHIMQFHVDSGRQNFIEVIVEYEKQLPGDRMTLIGRDEQIQDVMKSLVENKCKGILLYGLGGMGKTTLAEEICYRLKHDYNYGLIKIDMKGKESLVDLSQGILIAQNQLWGGIGDRLNAEEFSTTSTKSSVLKLQVLQSLGNFSNDFVLLLDNLDDLQREVGENLTSYLRDLFSEISELGDQCKLRMIMTTRLKFHTAILKTGGNIHQRYDEIYWREEELKGLSQEDGQKLAMKSASPRLLTFKESSNVAESCRGCPLAICIMSRLIRQQWEYPVSDAISSIKWELSDVVLCCIEKSFEYLSQEIKEQFIQLSVFNLCPFNVQNVTAIWSDGTFQESIARAEMTLLQLKYRHMVECRGPCDPDNQGLLTKGHENIVTYSLHPLVFNSVSTLLKDSTHFVDCINLAESRFLELYLNKLLEFEEGLGCQQNHAFQISVLDKIHLQSVFSLSSASTVLSPCDVKLLYSLEIKTCKRLAMFARSINRPEDAQEVFQRLAKTSKELGNSHSFFFWSVQQAEACLDCDMIMKAEDILRGLAVEEYCKKDGKVDVYRLFTAAEFHCVQGMLFNKKKNYSQALKEFDRSSELYKTCEPDEAFTVYHAAAINAKGNVYFKLEDFSSALKCHQTSYELIDSKIGGGFHEHKSIYLHNIGSIHHAIALKNWNRNKEEANALLGKALEKYDECIEQDLHYKQTSDPYHADRLRIRSDIYLRLKRFPEAIADAKKALKIQQYVHDTEHRSITVSRYQLARCYMKKAKENRSIGLKEEAEIDQNECWLIFVQIQDAIKKGGLSRMDQQYPNIRKDHLKLVKRYRSRQEQWKIERFYARFEDKGRLGESITSSRDSRFSSSMSSVSGAGSEDSVHFGRQDSGISEYSCSGGSQTSLDGMHSISSFQSMSLEYGPSIEEEVLMDDDYTNDEIQSPPEVVRPDEMSAAAIEEKARKRKLSDLKEYQIDD
ncbi:hypothetical protein CHS0354_032264 [Potamilus streckersoni]|uniref:AAA+ ATPase domain-containing protein n=1 Tax=Potamilus streckersoni TaxID=2493646 RepID=A0AAE0RPN4_9BIVA|nr:hypothetical protein CHS0354_032264 [Potamilus streckersoni]